MTLFRSLEKGAEWLLTLFLRPRRLEGEDGEDNYDYDDNGDNNHDNADDNPQAPVAPRLPRQHHGSLQLLEREEAPQCGATTVCTIAVGTFDKHPEPRLLCSAFTLWDENESAYIVVAKPLN